MKQAGIGKENVKPERLAENLLPAKRLKIYWKKSKAVKQRYKKYRVDYEKHKLDPTPKDLEMWKTL